MSLKPGSFFIAALALIIGTAACSRSVNISVEEVQTVNGTISGVYNTDSTVKIFKGIPFAAPPVGDLRWREPQPVENWQGVRDCSEFGPNAMQAQPVPRGVYVAEFLIPEGSAISEDCLYLNVWTAAETVEDSLPVIVYIHGGGFTEGSGSVPIYDGEPMAGKGVVFVTINYRLGVFGFFAHPELSAESPAKASGNYGLLDQIAALRWVRDNITAFGGNPGNVTIAGQSAGSMSVNALSASPLAAGLFHKIIAESGAMVLPGGFGGNMNLKDAEARGLVFQDSAHVNSLAELRQISAEDIMKIRAGTGSIITDGYVLPESIADVYAAGKQSQVPLLTGWNLDDALFSRPSDLAGYRSAIRNQYGENADKILSYYPAANNDEATAALKAISRDTGFGVQNFAWAIKQSESGMPVYLYFFARKVPEEGGASQYGAFHSGEITYAYDNHRMFNRPWEDADYELASIMSSYWANFAATGNPNSPGLPEWPAFNSESGMTMYLDTAPAAMRHPFYYALDFFMNNR